MEELNLLQIKFQCNKHNVISTAASPNSTMNLKGKDAFWTYNMKVLKTGGSWGRKSWCWISNSWWRYRSLYLRQDWWRRRLFDIQLEQLFFQTSRRDWGLLFCWYRPSTIIKRENRFHILIFICGAIWRCRTGTKWTILVQDGWH